MNRLSSRGVAELIRRPTSLSPNATPMCRQDSFSNCVVAAIDFGFRDQFDQCGLSFLAERLESKIGRPKFTDVLLLFVKGAKVAFFVANQALKELLGCGIKVFAALTCPLVVVARTTLFHLNGLGQHLYGIRDLLYRSGRQHLSFDLEEEDPFGEFLNVSHLCDGGPFE